MACVNRTDRRGCTAGPLTGSPLRPALLSLDNGGMIRDITISAKGAGDDQ